MLWIEKYRPSAFAEIVGQDAVIHHLVSFATTKTSPHLILTGPHGTGKSAAVECFARALYGENWEQNTTIFQTSDIFHQGKALLEQDERYAHIYQKNLSLIANFKYIIKWYASLRPLDAEFKILVFEDAHTLTRDAQQALRRIMEQTSSTCRFIFTTTNASAIIPAIASRCLPLFFSPIDQDSMLPYLKRIMGTESSQISPCSEDDLDLIVQASGGDLRKAVLLLQVALATGKCQKILEVAQSETATIAGSAVTTLKEGDTRGAMRRLESLLIDYGLSGSEVLSEIRTVIKREYNDPRLAVTLADAEFRMRNSNNEFIQVGALTTRMREILL
ncbi:AAA family ATPase [Methanoregula formicica]|uniref:Replication factor C small subunit n=1 Tax=Methanoregula formicica (strain DSM 22288 / NBRC 105244 / SMSP) TaxID=593750 RepID=L0HCB2_METFS|nr:AAA family ATPase [Methanoregula formicica]AGB02382.1 DNA polymerase III, gamma/tau subunit [Methanoregula formicica SMSP]